MSSTGPVRGRLRVSAKSRCAVIAAFAALAFAALASAPVTWKYGIQYDGMCAGMLAGFAIMPMLGCPFTLNSVYSIGDPGVECFGVQPKRPV